MTRDSAVDTGLSIAYEYCRRMGRGKAQSWMGARLGGFGPARLHLFVPLTK